MPHISMNDKTKIYYNDVGLGHPVILIHGWPLNADMWEYQSTMLVENGFRVVSYDRRGFGRSSQQSLSYNYDTFANDLHEIIEQLELDNVSLVGFSMGGGEIARYLSRHGSSKVASAILISAVIPYMLKNESNPHGVDEGVFDDIINNLKEDRPKFIADFCKTFYGDGFIMASVSPEIHNWTSFLAFQASPKATIDCVTAFGKTDFRPDMQAFDIPTLIIHGTSDKTVPIKPTGEAAAKLIRMATFKSYDGAAHGLFITHKKELNDDLLMFLDSELTRRPSTKKIKVDDTYSTLN